MSKTIYIAGPMSGIKNFNFGAFDEAELDLKDINPDWKVINPANIDRAFGFEGIGMDGTEKLSKEELGTIMARDIEALSLCDAIYLLIGWEGSQGARIEKAFADMVGLEIMYEVDYV